MKGLPNMNLSKRARQLTADEWERRRYEIAKEVMACIMSNSDLEHHAEKIAKEMGVLSSQVISRWAVTSADSLIDELRKNRELKVKN